MNRISSLEELDLWVAYYSIRDKRENIPPQNTNSTIYFSNSYIKNLMEVKKRWD